MTYRLYHRAAAVAAGLSALLHLVMMGHGNIFWGLLMAGMALACLPCAGHLWRRPSVGLWVALGVMNAAMVAVHGGLWAAGALDHTHGPAPRQGEAGGSTGAGDGHHHGGVGIFDVLGMEGIFFFATGLAVLEVLAVVIALTFLSKARTARLAADSSLMEGAGT